jgi:hypothetical protein
MVVAGTDEYTLYDFREDGFDGVSKEMERRTAISRLIPA